MIPLPTIEHITVKLLSSNQTIKIRPILIKEEKILLMGADSTDTDLFTFVYQVIKNCIVEYPKNFDLDELPHSDFTKIFLELRKISKGEIFQIRTICNNIIDDKKCEKINDFDFNINKITKILNGDKVGRSNIVKITNDLGVQLKPMTVKFVKELYESEKILKENESILNIEMVKRHITAIVTENERYEKLKDEEIDQFIDSLTKEQYETIYQWFVDEPKTVIVMEWECPKCHKKYIAQEVDVVNFFSL